MDAEPYRMERQLTLGGQRLPFPEIEKPVL